MPGWHDATAELQAEGRLQMVGIIQEQHPDRARLFMQWKQMDWPLMVDSLGLLGVTVVPITVAIDEYGIIRKSGLRMSEAAEFARSFVETDYPPPDEPAAPHLARVTPGSLRPPEVTRDPEVWRRYGDALIVWERDSGVDGAIAAYRKSLRLDPDDGVTRFNLGVAYRMRYDSGLRRPGDFQSAVDAWSEALAIDPNNYIWRRRIQQYGPRLDKPYPFYDWVPQARVDISGRGEDPSPLVAEPGGAEFADRATTFTSDGESREPDPQGKIHRDKGHLVEAESIVVPPTRDSGAAARVHLVFRPLAAMDAHWNNEVAGLVVWVDPPPGWEIDRRLLTVPNPATVVSDEVRRVEFELQQTVDASPPGSSIRGSAYALYYVCEGIDGTCLYRRQDIELVVFGDGGNGEGRDAPRGVGRQ